MQRGTVRSRRARRWGVATLCLAVPTVACAPQPGAPEPVRTVATGLEGPFGLDARGGRAVVAESGDGEVTVVDLRDGDTWTLADGFTSPAGVARVGGRYAVVTGGAEVPDASITGDSTVFLVDRDGDARPVADLEAYELANNPDGQVQFDPTTGAPVDALSNPFAIIEQRGPRMALVADAGANDVLSIGWDGSIETFFVPPTVTTGACADAPNNPGTTGCDAVPTGLAYGPGGRLYVSALTAEVPGEGRVYVLDRDGAVLDVISGFDGPTGVAVAPDGTIYVSEVLYGAPQGEPPAGFDPASVGRIVRVAPDGTRTAASVPMPTGLKWSGGRLLASAWSTAGFMGMPAAGQVVEVRSSAFDQPV